MWFAEDELPVTHGKCLPRHSMAHTPESESAVTASSLQGKPEHALLVPVLQGLTEGSRELNKGNIATAILSNCTIVSQRGAVNHT